MYELAPLIYDLALMLGLASIVVLLFQRIHQPVVLGYLVAGVIVGPYTPPYPLIKDVNNIQILSELGVIFLMFSLGLEFSFQKLTRVGTSATVTGVVEVILMIFLGYWVAKALGWTHYEALFLGAALSISSTTIIIKAIDELGLKTQRFAELIFGVLIIEDLLAILLLVALSTVVYTKNVFSFDLFTAAIRLLVVVSGWFLTGYFLIVPFFKLIANYITQETLTIISVASCLLLVCLAASLHYSTPLGAFIMGSILAETPLLHRIEELIRPIRDIFAAVFFISVGMLINPYIIIQQWPIVLLLALVTIFGKIIATTVGALLTGQSFDRALRTGFGMAQIGEFSFIIITLGLSLAAINNKIYPIIVAVSGVTTFTTPYLIRLSAYFSKKLDIYLPMRIKFLQQVYAATLYRLQGNNKQQSILAAIGVRVLFNGIVVALIFSVIHYLVFHRWDLYSEQTINAGIFFLILSLALSAPFIWGMLFVYRKVPSLNPNSAYIRIIIGLVWLCTFFEIFILSIVYFNAARTIVILFIAAAIFIYLFSHLEKFYFWLENRLVSNINRNHPAQHTHKELAPWDVHLIELTLTATSELIGKSLRDYTLPLRLKIIALGREHGLIHSDIFEMELKAGDILVVLGMAEDVESFKQKIGAKIDIKTTGKYLKHCLLTPYLISAGHVLINKNIHEAHQLKVFDGQIVGLDRCGERILCPAAEIRLQAHDLLLIVAIK